MAAAAAAAAPEGMRAALPPRGPHAAERQRQRQRQRGAAACAVHARMMPRSAGGGGEAAERLINEVSARAGSAAASFAAFVSSHPRAAAAGAALGFLMTFVASGVPPDFLDRLARFAGGRSSVAAGGKSVGPTTIYDCKGRVLAKLSDRYQASPARLATVAPELWQAIVASEDKNFFSHCGVEPTALARSVSQAVFGGGLDGATGGSTITQQLAKNLFLSSERKLSRKAAEMALAIGLDLALDKQTILELYINRAYWGHGAYGVEAAASTYFQKPPSKLELEEAAVLAAMLPAPEALSPYRAPEATARARDRVLRRMRDAGYIDESQRERASSEPVRLPIAATGSGPYRAPHFVDEVLRQLYDRYGAIAVLESGWAVHTTLDIETQEFTESLLRSDDMLGAAGKAGAEAAAVGCVPGSGAVRVMVGGRDYARSQFNRAVQASRSPGSAFKPFVYLAALAAGDSLTRRIVDDETEWELEDTEELYRPQNYNDVYHGTVTLEEALVRSYNIPAVKLLEEVGAEAVVEMAHALGIESPLETNLSLGLGGCSVTPLELCDAYNTIAANGRRAEQYFVERIEDSNGEAVFQHVGGTTSVCAPEAAGRLNLGLSGALSRGTGRAGAFGRQAAGKTGTSDDSRDVWFAGYTPQMSLVVWAGRDDFAPMGKDATASKVAAPLWGEIMRFAHAQLPVVPLFVINDRRQKMEPGRAVIESDRERQRWQRRRTFVEDLQSRAHERRAGENVLVSSASSAALGAASGAAAFASWVMGGSERGGEKAESGMQVEHDQHGKSAGSAGTATDVGSTGAAHAHRASASATNGVERNSGVKNTRADSRSASAQARAEERVLRARRAEAVRRATERAHAVGANAERSASASNGEDRAARTGSSPRGGSGSRKSKSFQKRMSARKRADSVTAEAEGISPEGDITEALQESGVRARGVATTPQGGVVGAGAG